MQNVSYPVVVTLSVIILLWSFFWKGVSLWTATKENQKKWFIFLLICIFPTILFNAIGIVDLVYLFFFAKKKLTFKEIKSWKSYFFQNAPKKK
jgi:hypothetical protein